MTMKQKNEKTGKVPASISGRWLAKISTRGCPANASVWVDDGEGAIRLGTVRQLKSVLGSDLTQAADREKGKKAK